MYPIVEVPLDAPLIIEQVGTKDKFWFNRNESDRDWLFKRARPGSGEDWAEKVAAELCDLIGMPHAHYDLAVWNGQAGVVTKSFVPPDGRLVLGNELLARIVRAYPQDQNPKDARRSKRLCEHTLSRVMAATTRFVQKTPMGFIPFLGASSAIEVFVGYLMFDAWIANQDRHHKNWGLINTRERITYLTPSFDHGSSLGRNERDDYRSLKLSTRGGMDAYVARAVSPLYATPSEAEPLSPIDAFCKAGLSYPQSAITWLKRLADIPMSIVEDIFNNIQSDRISDPARGFALQILSINRSRLIDRIGLFLR
jgi:hypothetical protein